MYGPRPGHSERGEEAPATPCHQAAAAEMQRQLGGGWQAGLAGVSGAVAQAQAIPGYAALVALSITGEVCVSETFSPGPSCRDGSAHSTRIAPCWVWSSMGVAAFLLGFRLDLGDAVEITTEGAHGIFSADDKHGRLFGMYELPAHEHRCVQPEHIGT